MLYKIANLLLFGAKIKIHLITVIGKYRNYHKSYILHTKTNHISGRIQNRRKFLKKMKREQPVGSK